MRSFHFSVLRRMFTRILRLKFTLKVILKKLTGKLLPIAFYLYYLSCLESWLTSQSKSVQSVNLPCKNVVFRPVSQFHSKLVPSPFENCPLLSFPTKNTKIWPLPYFMNKMSYVKHTQVSTPNQLKG